MRGVQLVDPHSRRHSPRINIGTIPHSRRHSPRVNISTIPHSRGHCPRMVSKVRVPRTMGKFGVDVGCCRMLDGGPLDCGTSVALLSNPGTHPSGFQPGRLSSARALAFGSSCQACARRWRQPKPRGPPGERVLPGWVRGWSMLESPCGLSSAGVILNSWRKRLESPCGLSSAGVILPLACFRLESPCGLSSAGVIRTVAWSLICTYNYIFSTSGRTT